LESAIRDQADLCDLFPPEPLPNSRLQRAVPMSALPDEQTSLTRRAMSEKCQQPTSNVSLN
jgi:hypothetical protein